MSVDVKLRYGTCPTCHERTHVDSWSREPRETTHEQPGIPMFRTYEPGPESTVVLGCGHVVIDGAEAVEQLLANFKPDASGELRSLRRAASAPSWTGRRPRPSPAL